MKKYKMVSVFTSLMKTRGMLGEHEISVGNHDAKRSGFQLIQLVLFDNNSFSLFAFVLLLTLGYKHSFVCKGCYFIP